jgi:hypothetical protein
VGFSNRCEINKARRAGGQSGDDSAGEEPKGTPGPEGVARRAKGDVGSQRADE